MNRATWQAASFYSEKAQVEMFASAPFVASSRAISFNTSAERVEGGYRLSGTWDYNSGCWWSTHAMQVAPVDPGDGSDPVPRLGKYYKDVAMYKTHIGAQFDAIYASNARFVLGQPLDF